MSTPKKRSGVIMKPVGRSKIRKSGRRLPPGKSKNYEKYSAEASAAMRSSFLFSQSFQVLHGAVAGHNSPVFFLVIKSTFSFSEGFGDFDREAHRQLDVDGVAGSRGTAGDRDLGCDGDADDRRGRGCGRLQDAVEMIDVIPVRRDILGCDREDDRHPARDILHDIQ